MFTDELRRNVWEQVRQRDIRQFGRFLTPPILRQAAMQAGVRMGASALNVTALVWLGIASALHTGQNFAGILTLAFRLLADLINYTPGRSPSRTRPQGGQKRRRQAKGKAAKRERSKHGPRGSGDPSRITEEAFVQARQRMPMKYWIALILLLGQAFERQHGGLVYFKNFRLLTLDGSCIDLPGWRALKDHYGTASNGRGRCTAQARMLMLQLPLVRMPWRYALAPLARGERTIAAGLLNELRPNDLLLMDRGFWSYGIFWQIQKRSAFFAIRLMKGVGLKTIRQLGRKDRLVEWTPSNRQWKKARLPRSIQLRVIDYQIRGFRPSAIVTNVLSPARISRADWVRLSTQSEPGQRKLGVGLYHRRWEIETTFLELKVQQKMESGLRSRRPAGIEYEIAAHVVLYLLVRWLMVEAAVKHGMDPLRLSFTEALREMETMAPALMIAGAARVAEVLLPRLLERIAGHTVPWRPGRYDPRPGDTRVKNKGKGKRQLPAKLAANET